MNPANALSQLSPGMAECHARLMVVAKHGTPDAFSATLAGVLHRAELSISNAYDAGAKSIQIEAIGACGVSGPLVGQPQAVPDLSQLTERGAVAWAGVDAQGLRDGGASLSANAGEPRNAIDRDALIDAIAQGLHGTWHCTRVWEAWHVGTMSQDDFKPVDESETPTEIADAVLALLAAHTLRASHGEAPAGAAEELALARHTNLAVVQRLQAKINALEAELDASRKAESQVQSYADDLDRRAQYDADNLADACGGYGGERI